MDHEKIRSQQNKILAQIETLGEAHEPLQSSLLESLCDHDKTVIHQALGNFGVRLLGFTTEVAFAHPDLFRLYDSAFADGSDFSNAALDLLKLSKQNQLSPFVAENLSRVITKHPQFKMLSRVIDAPSKNFSHIRFTRVELREQLRSIKKESKVDLRVLRTKGSDCWEDSPDDFASYTQFFNRLLPLIEEATEQHKHFTSFGLTSLASEIEAQLSKIVAESKDDRYYGFNRVTMTSAAVILGRMFGATFEILNKTYSANKRELKSRLEYRQFQGNFMFDALSQEFCLPTFNYEPVVVPLHDMERVPGEMVTLLRKLDKWPEASGHSIFDNFWVMLPKIDPAGRGDRELMYDLLEDGRLVGVLLGEKDGEVYFVSYWM